MNVTLKDARLVDASRRRGNFSHFFVQNRLVRFVQIPTEIDLRAEIIKKFDPKPRGNLLQ